MTNALQYLPNLVPFGRDQYAPYSPPGRPDFDLLSARLIPADAMLFPNAVIHTPLWGRSHSWAFLGLATAGCDRVIWSPPLTQADEEAFEPKNKAALLGLVPWSSFHPETVVVMADADVIPGPRDLEALVAVTHNPSGTAGLTILTGGADTAGVFACTSGHLAQAFAALRLTGVLPALDGWGFEDLGLMASVLQMACNNQPDGRPRDVALGGLSGVSIVSAEDTVALAHPSTLRQRPSDGSSRSESARRNQEVFRRAGFLENHAAINLLLTHSAKQWRSDVG